MTCNFIIKEKYATRHYQDDTKILTNSSTRNTQRVEGNNNISWTEI